MTEDLKIKSGIVIPSSELVFSASRSGGPGGQHANKTSSRVTLNWSIESSSALNTHQKMVLSKRLASRLNRDGLIQIHVEESRSQLRNKELACDRLKELLVSSLTVIKKRKPTKPSKASKKRRLDAKKARGSVKKMRRSPSSD